VTSSQLVRLCGLRPLYGGKLCSTGVAYYSPRLNLVHHRLFPISFKTRFPLFVQRRHQQLERASFLPDLTNGSAYATMFCLSVVCLLYVLWLNGASCR